LRQRAVKGLTDVVGPIVCGDNDRDFCLGSHRFLMELLGHGIINGCDSLYEVLGWSVKTNNYLLAEWAL
jgi:hypothetical protein